MAQRIKSVSYWLVAATVLVAMIMSTLPMPQWARLLWPEWILLVVIYWCLAAPEKLNIKFAWSIGILADLLKGSLLGQHALLYTLIAYLTTRFHQRLRLYPAYQQIFFIALLVLLHTVLSLWISAPRYSLQIDWHGMLPVASSMLAWPWVFAVLRHLRRRSYADAQG